MLQTPDKYQDDIKSTHDFHDGHILGTTLFTDDHKAEWENWLNSASDLAKHQWMSQNCFDLGVTNTITIGVFTQKGYKTCALNGKCIKKTNNTGFKKCLGFHCHNCNA